MKYWWLEKYRNFKIIQTKELQEDVNYFLVMPKNYEKQYQILKEKNINTLKEEELLILLKKIISTKNIKDNSLNTIINKLLEIPDNSFPASDYTLLEMLKEIKNLKNNPPFQEKIENNNIAICYHCLNIFYVDQINSVNKNHLCLCPYCLKTQLYFDNDYIPMNYTFMKLANFYYNISSLGCTFQEIQKIIKKNIQTKIGKKEKNSIQLSNIIPKNKLRPIDEKIIYRKLYQILLEKEKNMIYQISIYLPGTEIEKLDLKILILSTIEILSNSLYLKEITFIFNQEKDQELFLSYLKTLKTFH